MVFNYTKHSGKDAFDVRFRWVLLCFNDPEEYLKEIRIPIRTIEDAPFLDRAIVQQYSLSNCQKYIVKSGLIAIKDPQNHPQNILHNSEWRDIELLCRPWQPDKLDVDTQINSWPAMPPLWLEQKGTLLAHQKVGREDHLFFLLKNNELSKLELDSEFLP